MDPVAELSFEGPPPRVILTSNTWALEEIVERCGAAVWIVPEPLERWGTGDSALAEYLPQVDVAVEVRDLSGLARGVGELLRRI